MARALQVSTTQNTTRIPNILIKYKTLCRQTYCGEALPAACAPPVDTRAIIGNNAGLSTQTAKAANLYWWRADQFGMQLPRPMNVWVDNRQAESLANNTCLNSKLGGVFDMRDSRIKEVRDKGAVDVRWVRRDYNPADVLTHCMPSGSFNRMVRAINSQLRFSRDHNGQGGI